MPLPALAVVPAALTPVPPPLTPSPAEALVPAKALMAPPVASVEPLCPALPALALPPVSTMMGGTWLRPAPPTGGGRSTSPHANATQATSTQYGVACRRIERVTPTA
jgi:hypothetical protein